jgi:hypothetical protein
MGHLVTKLYIKPTSKEVWSEQGSFVTTNSASEDV